MKYLALLLLPCLLFLFSGCNTAQIHNALISNVLPSHTFTITAPPTLTIHNDSGSITLHAGKSAAVVITALQREARISSRSTPTLQPGADDMQVNYDQQGNTISVEALNISRAALRAVSVDFDVTMPAEGNVQLYTGYGSIEADGLRGQTTLESHGGDITATNIGGAMTIHDSNGSVGVNNMRGTLSLTLSNGDVELRRTRLTGSSQIITEQGSIFFAGSLNPHGNYHFSTEHGAIELTLPVNSSFNLQVSTEHGAIENAFGSTQVGIEPSAQLHVDTETGSIAIHSR